MSVCRYKYLSVDEEEREVYYLGYRLALTKSEMRLLCAILNSGDGIEKSEFCDVASVRRGSDGAMKTHICNINKKAVAIGGRKLILCDDGRYRINEFM